MRRKAYRLYAVVYEPGMEERMEKYPFCRFGCGDLFVLIYSDRRPPQGSEWTEIREKDAGALSDAERKWLFECNVQILAEETKKRSREILRDLSLKVGALEGALRTEAERSTYCCSLKLLASLT